MSTLVSSSTKATRPGRDRVWQAISIVPIVLCALWLMTSAAHANPFVFALDSAVEEGNGGVTNLVFTVALSEASADMVMVDYSTLDVSAIAGTDYTAAFGVAIFSPGTLTQFVSVNIQGDLLNEADETFWLRLTNAVNATLLNNHSVGTILNDDPMSALSIGDVSVLEGNSGSTNAVFAVDLAPASGQTVTIDYVTVNGSATGGADFLAVADTITFVPGATHATLTVPVYGELLSESTESFFVQLTNPVAATVSKSVGVGTILDDDPIPSLTIADTVLLEGNSGVTNALFLLSLAPSSGQTVTVSYATSPATALSGVDFVATNGLMSFAPGTSNLSVKVAVVGDTQIEPNKSFAVNLSNPSNVSLSRTQAVGTILDDETRILAFTNGAQIVVPDFGAGAPYPAPIEISGLTGTVVAVTATLSGLSHTSPDDLDVLLVGPLGQRVLLMSDAGGIAPVAGLNLVFSDAAAGSLPNTGTLASGTFKPTNFGAGDSFTAPAPGGPFDTLMGVFNGLNPNGTWALYVYDDAGGNSGVVNGGWTLGLTLSNLVCCAGSGDADLSVTVTDSPDSIAATSNLTYTVRVINNGPAIATGVRLTNTLAAGVNYVSASSAQGSISHNGQVVVWDLGGVAVGATVTASMVASPSALGMVTNVATVAGNELDPNPANNNARTPTTITTAPVSITIADLTLVEGNNGTTNAQFVVSLSRTNSQAVSVDYASTNGTAQAGSDYVATSGTLTWLPGETNQTILVPVYGDTGVEPNETFTVGLQNPVNAVMGRAVATGTILNDDGLPGVVDHFSWSAVASPQLLEQPFNVSITARDAANNVVSGFNRPVLLKGLAGAGPEVSIVIAEIDTGEIDRVEFANVSGGPVDLSGWRIVVYDWVSWPEPEFVFTVPAGTVAGANALFVLSDNGVAPGSYPSFFSGVNSYWDNSETNNAVAVLLQDAVGGIVDFACAFDPDISEIALPLPIPASQWSGPPIEANTNSAQTFQRTGNSDNNNSNNWLIANSTLGSANPGLSLLFNGTHPVPITPGAVSNFSGGVWSGNVAVLQTGTGITLRANDFDGHSGSGNAFNVNAAADLALSMTASTNNAPAAVPVVFTMLVTNAGPSPATAVFVTNVLASGYNFGNATSSQGSWTRNGSLVSAAFGTLAKGSTASLVVSGSFGAPGPFTNLAQVYGATADPAVSNNVASVVTSVALNHSPSLSPISNQIVAAGNLLQLTAQASDLDAGDTLTFSFGSGAPAGASLSPSGLFSWTPSFGQAPSTNLISVRVTDNGVPSLSATQTFMVRVLPVVVEAPVIDRIELVPGRYEIRFKGEPGYSYQVQFALTSNAVSWQSLTNLALASVVFEAAASDTITGPQRFYRALNNTVPDQPPFISRAEREGDVFTLYFEGEAGRAYSVEYRDGMAAGSWSTLTTISLAAMWIDAVVVDPANVPGRFYRVMRSDGVLIPVESAGLTPGGCLIYFTARAGQGYTIEYRDSLSAGGWQALTTIAPQSGDSELIVPDYGISGKTQRFYRIKK